MNVNEHGFKKNILTKNNLVVRGAKILEYDMAKMIQILTRNGWWWNLTGRIFRR